MSSSAEGFQSTYHLGDFGCSVFGSVCVCVLLILAKFVLICFVFLEWRGSVERGMDVSLIVCVFMDFYLLPH